MYHYKLNDYREDIRAELTLSKESSDFDTLDDAINAAWDTIILLAELFGLGYENQGDQLMAYYDSGEFDGWGAFTIELYDGDKQIEFD